MHVETRKCCFVGVLSNDEPASVLLERIRGERNGRKNGKVEKKAVENVVLEEPVSIDVEGVQQAGLWEEVGG